MVRRENAIEISIIIPFYNAEKYIETCIRSLQAQTYCDFEAIFVNDGSIDASVSILEKFCDERFVVVSQDNQGVSSARNTGIKIARGTYLTFMDVDDELEPTFFEKLLFSMKKFNPSAVLCDFSEIYRGGKVVRRELPWKNQLIGNSEIVSHLIPRMIYDYDGNGIMASVCRMMIRRDYLQRVAVSFNEEICIAEDLLFLIPVLKNAASVYVLSESLYRYNKMASSAMNRYNPDGLKNGLLLHCAIPELLKNENLLDDNRTRYYMNKLQMYTNLLSNSSRSKNLFSSLKELAVLRSELKKEPFEWRDYPLSKGRKLSLWMLEYKMDVILLALYKMKEMIRLRRFN